MFPYFFLIRLPESSCRFFRQPLLLATVLNADSWQYIAQFSSRSIARADIHHNQATHYSYLYNHFVHVKPPFLRKLSEIHSEFSYAELNLAGVS